MPSRPMLPWTLQYTQAALSLWLLGVWESLQLHRCVILFVLDNSRELWEGVWQCLVLNGALFLGSVAWRALLLQPCIHWLSSRWIAPCWGPAWAASLDSSLDLLFELLLLLPLYATTMLASSREYSKVARAAYAVQRGKQAGAGAPPPPGPAARPSGGATGFENVAQELYRVLLLSVYYVEAWLLGKVPVIGPTLYFISMTWLWAYYCYDYKWSLQAWHLADRLTYFESRWAFFSGFGFIMSAATLLLPFYWGAACSALLFPLFITVACESDPDRAHQAVQCMGAAGGTAGSGGCSPAAAGGSGATNDSGSKAAAADPVPGAGCGKSDILGQIPIFQLALWPCQKLFRKIAA